MKALNNQIGGNHYKNFEYQPIEFFMDMKLNFIQCNIIKYIVRHRQKNGIEDVKKAKHYAEIGLEMRIDVGDKINWNLFDKFLAQIEGAVEKYIVDYSVVGDFKSVLEYCDDLISNYEQI